MTGPAPRRLLVLPFVVGITALAAALVMGTPAVAAQHKGDADAGERIYRSSCAMCHGSDATGMMGMHPALRGAVDRLTREGVEVAIRNGRDTNPPMPAFGDRLSDDEIAHVIAYLESLPDGPRNFGPDREDGMGGGMGGGMMDGMPGDGSTWMVILVIVLAAGLAGVIGYLVGSTRARRHDAGSIS